MLYLFKELHSKSFKGFGKLFAEIPWWPREAKPMQKSWQRLEDS